MAGISATGQEKVKTGFAPLLEGFTHLPFGDQRAISFAAADPTVVAILIEPIQGEGGIHPAPPDFLPFLRQLCDKHDLLLLYDEIQCGLGRTGDWSAWQTLAPSAQPDAVSWAKGIANGYPLGAFWVRSESVASGYPLCDLLGPGSHGTTYGGNPVCCAAALAVLQIIEKDNLLQNVRTCGKLLLDSLRRIQSVHLNEVRGVGLMVGIELAHSFPLNGSPTPAAHFVRQALERGLLLIPAGERVVRFLPPLNVTADLITKAVQICSEIFDAFAIPHPRLNSQNS